MSAISNTFQTYDARGIREDLSDVIYNISPTETPFMSNAGRGKATNTFFEWQTDSLANTDTTNHQLEGDDVTSFDAVSPTARLGNYTQISRKTVIIADTEEAVDKAGRKSELAYQLAKKGKELKRDMEAILLTNQGAVVGSDSVARQTGALIAFIKTNVNKASDGSNPTYTNIPTGTRTDGTARSITEDMLKDVIQQGWTQGADFSTFMVGGTVKQAVSGFSGIATKTYYQSAKAVMPIIGAADVYVSDFGTLSIVPNRFQRSIDGLLLDYEFVSVDFLRPFKQKPLAETGDAKKRLLIVEYGLRVKNEKALGLVADVQAWFVGHSVGTW